MFRLIWTKMESNILIIQPHRIGEILDKTVLDETRPNPPGNFCLLIRSQPSFGTAFPRINRQIKQPEPGQPLDLPFLGVRMGFDGILPG